MTRKELYAFIKDNNLEEAVKECFNDNFTRVSNMDLEKIVKEFTPTIDFDNVEIHKVQEDCGCCCPSTPVDHNCTIEALADLFMRLLATLQTKGVITKEDCAYIGNYKD